MYQIRYTDGLEIHVIGVGENGLCRIVDRNGSQLFAGTYASCVQWLADRGVTEERNLCR